jgi:predicted kinase
MGRKHLAQKKVTLLYGLPASGKTFYAKLNSDESLRRPNVAVVDVDAIDRYLSNECRIIPPYDKIEAHVGRDVTMKLVNRNEVIVDGLITSVAVAKKYLAAIAKEANGLYEIHYKIVWFSPDREACLWNDKGRRKQNAEQTIRNLPFEEPSEEDFKDFVVKVKLERKRVVRKPAHKAWAGENDMGDQDTLESDTWCLGGSWCDYNGNSGTVSPSPQPATFEEFDKLLEKVCPNITFLQYRKVYAASVTIKESSDSDYYGGTTHHAQYVCDLKKLHEALKEIGVIE